LCFVLLFGCPSVVAARKAAYSSLHRTLINSFKKLGDVYHRTYEMGIVFLIKNDIEIKKLSLLEVLVYVVLGIWMTTRIRERKQFSTATIFTLPHTFFSFLSKLMGIDIFA